VFGMPQLLVAEVNHLVPEQCVTYLRELFVRHTRRIDTDNLRTHGRGKRSRLDMPIRCGMIVELSCRVKSHRRPHAE